jgi:hypothetical protein
MHITLELVSAGANLALVLFAIIDHQRRRRRH